MNDRYETSETPRSFAEEAEEKSVGFFREFWDFLKHNKKWWLVPILLVLLIVGTLVVIAGGGSALAPFIYAIF